MEEKKKETDREKGERKETERERDRKGERKEKKRERNKEDRFKLYWWHTRIVSATWEAEAEISLETRS
jgi:hypothetical protein